MDGAMRLMTSMRVSIVALCAVAALAAPAYGQNVEPTVLQSFRANFERNVGQAAPDAVPAGAFRTRTSSTSGATIAIDAMSSRRRASASRARPSIR